MTPGMRCRTGSIRETGRRSRAVDFVVESDRDQLREIVQRVRDGRLRTNIGAVSTINEAVDTFNSTERRAGKTVIRVRP